MTFGPVAIFWDYENCSPQHGAGFAVVDNIRQIAHQYGSIKVFKAYLELSEQSSTKSINLRSELQSCGVSLTDCPHNGRKDVADKMMIVDMLTYAIDTPAPATIILISGDRDFVYAVSVLRLRQYHVVVVAPASAHSSLRSRASEVYDWDSPIVSKVSQPAPNPNHPGYTSIDISAGRSWIDGESVAQRPGHHPMQSSGSLSRSVRRHSFRESGVYSPFMNSHTVSPTKTTRSDSGAEPPQGTPLNASYVFPKTSSGSRHVHNADGERGESFAAKHAVRGSITMPLKSLSPAPVDTTLLSPISPATNAGVLVPSEPSGYPIPTEDSASAAGPRADNLNGDSIPISDAIGDAVTSLPVRKNEIVKENCSYAPQATETRPSDPSSTEDPCAIPAVVRPTAPDSPLHEASHTAEFTVVNQASTASYMPRSFSQSKEQTSLGDSPYLQDLPTIALASPPPPVPAAFMHMVEILDNAHREGLPRLLRSHVAVQLTQRNPTIYQEAGVTKFKDYAALAERLGLVELGGLQGTAWIALKRSHC
ncbi:hypothetical protein NM688_g3604 [Phlebia brevispora]|uniref:Uncharacterized protein n=1 Tax=Phlebia brevispora TaxID=194682 RepID=A0ACC1T5F3_9APHY|nr:hypothetical protein NM688_g3604 [Phlebia brevispora]